MEEALRSERNYDPGRDLHSWLHGIAMNVVRRHVERFGRDRRRLSPAPPNDAAAVEALHEYLLRTGARLETRPDETVALREELEALLAPVPAQHQQVLRLFFLEHNQNNEAVAAALGISPGAARVRLCRALQAARKGSSR
jgi:RNA polymerase sigma factor (sigma-70 family)